MRRAGAAAGWVALTLVCSCERPRTELLVRVDSEVAWGPGRTVQSVVLTVRRGGSDGPLRSTRTTALGAAAGQQLLPLYVGVVAGDDVGTPVWVEALGCGDSSGCTPVTAVVAQRAVVRFVEGETQELPMTLASVCVGATCASDQRCAANGRCEAATVAQVTVRPFAGGVVPVREDAAVLVDLGDRADGGAATKDVSRADVRDVPVTSDAVATLDVMDAMAPDVGTIDVPSDTPRDDGVTLDVGTDVAHDGGADVGAVDTGGLGCAPGLADCDGVAANGCEVTLATSSSDCGRCGRSCTAPTGGSVQCSAGACVPSCPGGQHACAGRCVADDDVTACGAACVRCAARANAMATCAAGACAFACTTGFADCDGAAANGCEVATLTNAAHCGACMRSCPMSASCGGGVCSAAAPPLTWVRRFGTTGRGDAYASSIAVDAAGQLYVAGYAPAATDIGGGGTARDGGYLGSFTAAGAYRWSVDVRGGALTGSYGVSGVAVDRSGNSVTTDGLQAIHLQGHLAGGAASWERNFTPSTNSYLGKVAMDSNGNVVAIGYSDRSWTFGTTGTTLPAGSFALSLSASGGFRWARTLGANASDVAMDPAGNVYLAGSFTGMVDFGDGPVTATSNDAFVLALNSSGVFRWKQTIGGAGAERASVVAVQPTGDVVIAGFASATAMLGATTLEAGGFLLGLSSSGALRWTRGLGADVRSLTWTGIAVDPAGNVNVVGSFLPGSSDGSIDLGGGPLPGNPSAFGTIYSGAMASYGPRGAYRWGRTFPTQSSGRVDVLGVAATATDVIFVVGRLTRTADLGGGPTSPVGMGTDEIFIARYSP